MRTLSHMDYLMVEGNFNNIELALDICVDGNHCISLSVLCEDT